MRVNLWITPLNLWITFENMLINLLIGMLRKTAVIHRSIAESNNVDKSSTALWINHGLATGLSTGSKRKDRLRAPLFIDSTHQRIYPHYPQALLLRLYPYIYYLMCVQ